MNIPDLAYGSEWALMELLCLGLTTEAEQAAFDELVATDDLDWGVLLEQSLRHKMLPLLALHTLAAENKTVPRRVDDHLRLVLEINRHKRVLWYREADRVIRSLGDEGIVVFGRKDVAFESTLYNGSGGRRFGDIDLLIAPTDRDATLAALPKLGYEVGLYKWETRQLRPISRKNMLIFRMNPDHLPPHTRLSGDPIMPYFEIDFANSLTWHGSPYDVPLEQAMAEVHQQPVIGFSDITIPCLQPDYEFIGTVLHLFREAWFARWLEWEQDVDLCKFSDVIRLWKRYGTSFSDGSLTALLDQLDIVQPIAWVLEHIDRTFGSNIMQALDLEGSVTEAWLFSGRASGKQQYQWQGSMRERLYSKDREQLFVAPLEVAA